MAWPEAADCLGKGILEHSGIEATEGMFERFWQLPQTMLLHSQVSKGAGMGGLKITVQRTHLCQAKALTHLGDLGWVIAHPLSAHMKAGNMRAGLSGLGHSTHQ